MHKGYDLSTVHLYVYYCVRRSSLQSQVITFLQKAQKSRRLFHITCKPENSLATASDNLCRYINKGMEKTSKFHPDYLIPGSLMRH